jgi:hypothetical protein
MGDGIDRVVGRGGDVPRAGRLIEPEAGRCEHHRGRGWHMGEAGRDHCLLGHGEGRCADRVVAKRFKAVLILHAG